MKRALWALVFVLWAVFWFLVGRLYEIDFWGELPIPARPLPEEPVDRIVSGIPLNGGPQWLVILPPIPPAKSVSLPVAAGLLSMSPASAPSRWSRSFVTARRTPRSAALLQPNWQSVVRQDDDRLGTAWNGRTRSGWAGCPT